MSTKSNNFFWGLEDVLQVTPNPYGLFNKFMSVHFFSLMQKLVLYEL